MATTKTTPKDQVRQRWSSKDGAADAIVALIGDPDGKTKQRLRHASNGQLLALYAKGEDLKKRFGGRDALERAIVELKSKQGKLDEGYADRLKGYGVGRLLDMHRRLAKG